MLPSVDQQQRIWEQHLQYNRRTIRSKNTISRETNTTATTATTTTITDHRRPLQLCYCCIPDTILKKKKRKLRKNASNFTSVFTFYLLSEIKKKFFLLFAIITKKLRKTVIFHQFFFSLQLSILSEMRTKQL